MNQQTPSPSAGRSVTKARVMPKGSRYGAFLSVGDLLGLDDPRLKNAIKAQFLPQWEGYDQTSARAVLSKRFLLVDVPFAEVNRSDAEKLAKMVKRLDTAVREDPDELVEIVAAFGKSGSRQDRESVLDRAGRLGLYAGDDPEPVALWGVLLAVGAAILLAGCCQETDTPCDDDGGGTDTDK